jgi:hypothetical protein
MVKIMSDDSQDRAESFDEDMIGSDSPVTADQVEVEFPSERPHGIQFADADVTDESFADRLAQEQPEVGAADTVVDEAEGGVR